MAVLMTDRNKAEHITAILLFYAAFNNGRVSIALAQQGHYCSNYSDDFLNEIKGIR